MDEPLPRFLLARHALAYSYSLERLHPNVEEEAVTHAAWEAMRKSKRMKPRATSPAEVAVLDWLKAHLPLGQVVSVPNHLFNMATAPSADVPAPGQLQEIAEYIAPLAGAAVPAIHLDGLVFFRVVNPRPETQTYIEQPHIARRTDVMEVHRMTVAQEVGDCLIELVPEPNGGKTIWLSKWCDRETLRNVLDSAMVWESDAAHGSRQITVPTQPMPSLPVTLVPPLQDDLDEVMPFGAAPAPALDIVAHDPFTTSTDRHSSIPSLGIIVKPHRQQPPPPLF